MMCVSRGCLWGSFVRLIGPVLLITVPGFAHDENAVGDGAQTIAFIDMNVIPMTSDIVLRHQTVLIRHELITEVGPADTVKVPAEAARIRGAGLYLVPGLVDSHVHLETGLGARPNFGDAPLFLASGVTSVFNLRGAPDHLRWRQLIQSGQMLAPNLYTSGEFIDEPRVNSPDEAAREVLRQIHDGYDIIKIHEIEDPDFHVSTTTGLSRPAYNRLIETAQANHMPCVGHIPNDLGLDAALEEHQNLAHVVMYILGYFMPIHTRAFRSFVVVGILGLGSLLFGSILLGASTFIRRLRRASRTAIEEDRRCGRTAAALVLLAIVFSMVYSSVQWLGSDFLIFALTACSVVIFCLALLLIKQTVELSLETRRIHYRALTFAALCLAAATFTTSLFYFVPLSWRSTKSGIASIARRSDDAKIAVMTTLVVDHVHEMANDPELSRLSKATQNDWGITDGSITSQPSLQRLLAPHVRWFQEQITGELHLANVPLLLGTDTFGFPGVAPGISVHKELELLERAGLSPYDALRTATVNPARFLKQPNSFGQIAAGQRADLLLVDGNPLEDLRALRRLHGIVLRGKWIDAGQLANSVAVLVN